MRTTAKKRFYGAPNVAEMAALLGIELWGYAPDGRLRVADRGAAQPTGVMTDGEVTAAFVARFRLIPCRPGSGYVEAVSVS